MQSKSSLDNNHIPLWSTLLTNGNGSNGIKKTIIWFYILHMLKFTSYFEWIVLFVGRKIKFFTTVSSWKCSSLFYYHCITFRIKYYVNCDDISILFHLTLWSRSKVSWIDYELNVFHRKKSLIDFFISTLKEMCFSKHVSSSRHIELAHRQIYKIAECVANNHAFRCFHLFCHHATYCFAFKQTHRFPISIKAVKCRMKEYFGEQFWIWF